MQTHRIPLKTYQFTAIVEAVGAGVSKGSLHVRLLFGNGFIEADTWLFDPFFVPPALATAHVTVVEVPQAEQRYVLAGCHFDSSLSPAPMLADELCPIPGVVTQTKELIASIQSEPLRQMLFAALTHPEAALGYWKVPGSLHDHHCYDGGLAHHSLEIATMVSTSSGLADSDRDAGIVLALLHDYGKIWCYRDGNYTPAQKRGHVRIGLEKLGPMLECLRRACPTTAATIEELLGGPSQRADRRYPLAVGRVIHGFDQMSCEMERRRTRAAAELEF